MSGTFFLGSEGVTGRPGVVGHSKVELQNSLGIASGQRQSGEASAGLESLLATGVGHIEREGLGHGFPGCGTDYLAGPA